MRAIAIALMVVLALANTLWDSISYGLSIFIDGLTSGLMLAIAVWLAYKLK